MMTAIKCDVCNKDMLLVDKNTKVLCGLVCQECSKPQIVYPPQVNKEDKMIEVCIGKEGQDIWIKDGLAYTKIDPAQLTELGYIKREDAVNEVEIDENKLWDWFGGKGYSDKVDGIVSAVKKPTH